MLHYSRRVACFEHSIFLKVNEPVPRRHQTNGSVDRGRMRGRCWLEMPLDTRPPHPRRNPTTSFLTATTLVYAIGAGITAAAGTRLALQLVLVKGFRMYSFQLDRTVFNLLIFLVTTSLRQDWVIYAPAAFLRCGSRFSGSLSGIEP